MKRKIVVKDGVQVIGPSVFRGSNAEEITLPDSVEEIYFLEVFGRHPGSMYLKGFPEDIFLFFPERQGVRLSLLCDTTGIVVSQAFLLW